MSKNYIVSEERLLSLLWAEAKLECLERDGVDNWHFYMEGRNEYIAEALNIFVEEAEDMDFEDVARASLAEFTEA